MTLSPYVLQSRLLNLNVSSLNKTWTSSVKKNSIKIVLLSPFHNGFVQLIEDNISNMDRCHYNNCVLSIERKETVAIVDADAILFQGNRAPRFLPRRRDDSSIGIELV